MSDQEESIAEGGQNQLSQLMLQSLPTLRRMAHSRLFKSGDLTLLDTTSLVNETYLKLIEGNRLQQTDQQQFLAYCARTMRSLIIDYIRARQSEKRGSDAGHTELRTDINLPYNQDAETQILQLNDSLCALSDFDPRMAKVVEMRYFGGFLESEIASALSVDERTVRRDWEKARLFLRSSMQ